MNKKYEVGDKEKRRRQEPGGAVLKELEVRAAQPEERERGAMWGERSSRWCIIAGGGGVADMGAGGHEAG
jgi:hypothetical protein